METLTRLVTDSLARHGFNRPIDPRRLQWSRWYRCDSPHSLLVVPSKPGIFAIAEEIIEFGPTNTYVETAAPGAGNTHVETAAPGAGNTYVETAALGCPERSSAMSSLGRTALKRCDPTREKDAASATEVTPSKRMLAVLQFSEDDDMAFTLDRMFTRINPMRARLSSGRCFLRFVVMEDQDQRRSICSALNQWMVSSAEKASGIPAAFSSSVELNTAEETLHPSTFRVTVGEPSAHIVAQSGANKNLHCPQPLPSGF